MQRERPFVVSIAGFDPCGGAGVLADIKTFEQLSVQGLAVLTSNTIQVENKVYAVEWIPIKSTISQLEALLTFYPVSVIKIGIVSGKRYLEQLIQTIRKYNSEIKIIWDTVLGSSSGTIFFDEEEIPSLKEVFSQIDLITPNAIEFDILMKNDVLSCSKLAVLLKGGHREDAFGEDILFHQNNKYVFPKADVKTYPKHGSGCVLSSAIAAFWAKGSDLQTACGYAKAYIEQYLCGNQGLLGMHNNIKIL